VTRVYRRIKEEQMGVLDGLLLGDGHIRQASLSTGMLQVGISGTAHLDWLLSVREALEPAGLSIYPIKVYQGFSRGKPFQLVVLRSKAHPYLLQKRKEWYQDSRKIVPESLALTPITLAHWHMGDGTLVGKYPYVVLASGGFPMESVLRLKKKLSELGIDSTVPPSRKGDLFLSRRESLERFARMVDPFIVKSFRYKVQRILGRR